MTICSGRASTAVLAALCLLLFHALSGCGSDSAAAPDAATADDGQGDAASPDAVLPDAADVAAPDGPADGPGEDLPTDAPAADVPDAVAPDVPADTGPACPPDPPAGPFKPLCSIGCVEDGDCKASGARCLTFRTIQQSFCALPCKGEALSCPDGFYCAAVGADMLCVPLSGDCNVATLGIDCNGEDLSGICKNDYAVCTSADWRPGFCSRACDSDADCPGTWRRCTADPQDPCAPKVCRAVWEAGPAGCGVARPDAAGNGAACRDAADCPANMDCIAPPAASPAKGFCAASCAADADCPGGSTCGKTAGSSYCLPPACACLGWNTWPWSELLPALGLDACATAFHRDWLRVFPFALSNDPWRLERFHDIHEQPLAAKQVALADIAPLDDASGTARVTAALSQARSILEKPGEATKPAQSKDLPDAIAAYIDAAGGKGDPAKLEAALADVPQDLQAKLAPIVSAMTAALVDRNAVVEGIGDDGVAALMFKLGHGFVILPKNKQALPPASPQMYEILTSKFDYGRLFAAAQTLAEAVDAAGLSPNPDWPEFRVEIETPAGAFVFSGNGDDLFDPATMESKEFALIVDTGGNDTYWIKAGATASFDNPIAIALDLAGDDQYDYEGKGEPPLPALLPDDGDGRYQPGSPETDPNGPMSLSDNARQGSGRMGIGMLYDFGASADEYRSLRLSQGVGVFGVGVLYDGGGNDLYLAEALSQGAAIFGIGILVDEGGKDDYQSVHVSQGFAYAGSYGLLYDKAGNDSYLCLPGDPELGGAHLYYNPQNPGKSNTSMSQGFGFGRRADMSDGIFMSGGFGILRDAAGNDAYQADIFGIGGGYWFGTGILADKGGDDQYKGRWYVIGSAAHMANGIFLDSAGNDVYNKDFPLMNCSVGCGHDFSLGLLADDAGADTYFAPSLAIGAGNADGTGLLWDSGAGDDSYSSTADNTFGWANSDSYWEYDAFQVLTCIGLFVDEGGKDTYSRPNLEPVGIKNDNLWLNPPAHEGFGYIEKGAGIDGTKP